MDHLRRQSGVLAGEPIRDWIVVANGNADLVRAAMASFALAPRLAVLDSNSGSATGFGRGMTEALADPANRHLLLLDEDNLPEPGIVSQLLEVLRSEQTDRAGGVAIAAYRERAHVAQARGIDIRRPDSSIGFHVADLPRKLLRRITRRAPLSGRVSIRTSPYGGLFLDRSLIEVAGLPTAQFVLYGDDTEYTLRLTTAGVRIVLDTAIRIIDMDPPPPLAPTLFSFAHWLSIADDFRLYYGARNEAWLDRHRFARNPIVYRCNRLFVRSVLRLYARTAEQRRRLALFRAAAADGEAGRLGPNADYPLPGVGG